MCTALLPNRPTSVLPPVPASRSAIPTRPGPRFENISYKGNGKSVSDKTCTLP